MKVDIKQETCLLHHVNHLDTCVLNLDTSISYSQLTSNR